MSKTIQDFCNQASSWSVTLTERGIAIFRTVIGNTPLLSRVFLVRVPEQGGRAEHELCDQVRQTGIEEIIRQFHKDGLLVSLDELARFDLFEILKCVYRYESVFE